MVDEHDSAIIIMIALSAMAYVARRYLPIIDVPFCGARRSIATCSITWYNMEFFALLFCAEETKQINNRSCEFKIIYKSRTANSARQARTALTTSQRTLINILNSDEQTIIIILHAII